MNTLIHSAVRRAIRTNPAALVAASICFAALPAVAFDASPHPDGTPPDGTAAHPWKIDQPEDFDQIGSDGIHGPGACYVLTRNLDCRNEDHRVRYAFSGTFDGNYRFVSGIHVDQPTETGVGLFSVLQSGAVVRRLAVVDSYFRAAGAMGAVVGSMGYGSTVEECYSWGNTVAAVSTNKQSIGGIAGGESYQRPAAVVRNCFARDNTISSAFQTVGGICGYNDAFVQKCYSATSNLTAPRYVGGVIGYGGSGTVVDSYSDVSNSPSVQCGSSHGSWQNALVPNRYATDFNITSHSITELGWDPAIWSVGPDGFPWLTGFNLPPVAGAGPSQDVSLGSKVYLDGAASSDDHTPLVLLAYEWSIESAPAGSAAALSGTDVMQPMFTPDLPGVYTIKLTVTDEDGLADADTTTLDVRPIAAGGSFEDDLAGWTATGNVSIQSGPPYSSTDGAKLVAFNDRNTVPDGVLSQVVETVPGMVYRLQFDVGVLSYVNKQQRLGLEVSNGTVLLSDTITLAGTTGGKVTWQSKDYLFTVDGNSASIVFRDLSTWTNGIDLLLDHIRVTSTALPMQVVSEPGPGVGIEVSPVDVPGDGDGTTGFQRIFNPGSVVELLAPETFGTSMFFNWLKDGAHLDTDRWVEVTMDDAHLMTAVYWGGEPIITEQPVDANALEGGIAEFRVVASGGVPLDFQWRFEGSDIAGADSPVLLIDPVTPADAGSYDVVISNTYGTVSSSVVGLGIGSSFAGLENGGFEADFQGWTVSGNLAVKSDMPYVATEGVKLTAFNAGNSPPNGVLFQVFDTTPGQPYVLSFDMGVLAYNTRAQSMEVDVTGSPSLVSDTFTMNGAGGGKTIWRNQTMSFTADSARTTVLFRDVSTWTNAIDLMLDHVVVTPVIMRTLTVEGTPVGQVYVEYTPPDAFGGAAFWTDFSRNYPEGTQITLSAGDPYITSTYPSKGLVYNFQRWLMDDVEISTDPEVTFVLDGDRTLRAVYEEAPPVILSQPENVVTTVGGSAWFQVECVPYGYGAFQACQWRFNGIPIVGETTNTLLIDPVGVEHVGTYDVVVFNSSGASLASEPVTLTLATGSLTNGSFESEFDGWNTSGNVRVQNGSPAPDGVRIAAFNSGNTAPGGSVSQMFLTEPGRLYSMRFELGLLSYVVGWQEMEVTVEGDWPAASRTFRMNRASYREPTTRWETKTVNFVANGPETTITFRDESLSTNGLDLLLDHIRLVPPDPFLVTTAVDEDDGALGQGEGDSLREVLAEATGSAAANIRFAPTLDGATIVLDGESLVVDGDVGIDARELPGGLVVSGGGSSRVFEIMEGRSVSMAGLAVTGGKLNDPRESGGGILNDGNLSLERVVVTDCHGVGDVAALGGGIANFGNLFLAECGVTENWVINGYGGGIYNRGRLVVERTTVSHNSGDEGGGGGIFNGGELLRIVNSTIANNAAYDGSGGGILGEVSLMRHTTVSGNVASGVGGIDGAVVVMENSIVAGNLEETNLHDGNPTYSPSDLGSVLESRGANLIGGDPMLAPLGDHGGPTHTMPPASGSPAIDAAIMLATTPETDQRGFPRPVDGDGVNGVAPDIGAVERGAVLMVLNNADSGSGSLRDTVLSAPDGSFVRFVPSLSGQTVVLASGPIEIDKVIEIDGSDLVDRFTIAGTGTAGLLGLRTGSLVSVDSLVLTGGGGTNGGAIRNHGDLTMRRCVIRGNHANLTPEDTGGYAGGVANYGVLNLSMCAIENNSSDPWSAAGGVFNRGTMVAEECRIVGNEGGDFGAGGISNSGSMTIVRCTIGSNSAESNVPGQGGGGILNHGSCIMRDTSVVNNSAGFGPGGGVDNKGELNMYNCTLGSNFSTTGWAIRNEGTIVLNHSTVSGYPFDYGVSPHALSNTGVLTLANSVVAAASPYAGPDIRNLGGTIHLVASNFVGDLADSGLVAGPALLTGDPMLAPLGDHGGPTHTMPPTPGSPVIDAAIFLPSTPRVDQRGVTRPQGGAPDIGSVEIVVP